MRQTLLQPIAVEPGKEDAALLLDNLELLEQFGFGCEDFGDGAILVREVPADLDAADTAATLEEFAQNLRTGRNLDEKREALLHTMACKAAIKGGWTSDLAELRVLVEKVQSGVFGWLGYVTHHSKAWKQEYERYCRLRELPMNDGTAEKFLQMKQEELEEAIANGDA